MRVEMATATTRATAEERRSAVLDAAIAEFAQHGFHAAATTAIARRAGISQPYIYALFGSKKELFLATHTRVVEHIRETFAQAVEGAGSPGDALRRMGRAFIAMLGERDELRCQLQGYAASGDPDVREHVRREFTGLFDDVARMTGATRDEVALLIAGGMFFTIAGALEVPREYWPKPPYREGAT
jgi:AcrR family transcriptional regulator